MLFLDSVAPLEVVQVVLFCWKLPRVYDSGNYTKVSQRQCMAQTLAIGLTRPYDHGQVRYTSEHSSWCGVLSVGAERLRLTCGIKIDFFLISFLIIPSLSGTVSL